MSVNLRLREKEVVQAARELCKAGQTQYRDPYRDALDNALVALDRAEAQEPTFTVSIEYARARDAVVKAAREFVRDDFDAASVPLVEAVGQMEQLEKKMRGE